MSKVSPRRGSGGSTSIILSGELGCINSITETFAGSITGFVHETDPNIKIMKLIIFVRRFISVLATISVLGKIKISKPL